MQLRTNKVVGLIVLTLILTFSMAAITNAETLYSLNVNFTGYELGNKVKDIKVTVDSPNVVVKGIKIMKHNYHGELDDLTDNSVLEAGIRYAIDIFIAPKDASTDISHLKNTNIKINGANSYYYAYVKEKGDPYEGCYRVMDYLDSFKADEYKVAVIGGTAKINGKAITKAKPGDTVTVTLDEAVAEKE